MFSRVLAAALLLITFGVGTLSAQDATVAGTVLDASKAVLPGVTVTATGLDTGRQFLAITTDRGEYRLTGVQPGRYKIQAELTGFGIAAVPELELLVGQNARVDFTLTVANLTENVTVTGQTPLVDTRSASVNGNVDRRQMEELPIAGRNWLELSMMVKGVTANSVSQRPGVNTDARFQLNMDGQQITQTLCCSAGFGNPGLSRESIAEYQIVTNMFDVTMGRSAGLQVQAISRSGTNNLDGSFYGYFRDDRFNAKDFIANRVLPYSNQQVGGTVGGPVIRDRLQYFLSYEYEREPSTTLVAPPALTPQTLPLSTLQDVHNVLARGDYQWNNNNHLTVRGIYYRRFNDLAIGSQTYPNNGAVREKDSHVATLNWSRVISSTLLQEIKVSNYHYRWVDTPLDEPTLARTPEYRFPGLVVGPPWNQPQEYNTDITPSIRGDITWHKGSHDLKIGGEFLRMSDYGWWPARSRGQFFFSSLPPDIGRRIPLDSWLEPSRWDLSGLDPLVLRFDQNYARGDDWNVLVPRPTWALWIGDTWAINSRLTLTLGARYDLAWGDTATTDQVTETQVIINNGLFSQDVGFKNVRDVNNVAPRVGFTWKPAERNDFVIRGGSGIFYGQVTNLGNNQQWSSKIFTNSYVNDRRPGFLQDPTRGVSGDDIEAGRVPLPPQSPIPISEDFIWPYTWQSMLGFQKQLNDVTAFDADVVHYKGYNEDSQRDANLFFDAATGFNRHPNQFGRPNPAYGPIIIRESKGRSDYLGLATSFTRRYRDNWQAGLTYTLMFYKNDTCAGSSGYGCVPNNSFNLDADWARSNDFQRHTLRANAIYHLPWDISAAGSFFAGSGNYFNVTSGVNPYGGTDTRVRRDLSIIPRNSFKGEPLYKLDLRFSKEVRLVGDVRLTGIAEVFNVFNQRNFGSYNTLETSPSFGRPTQNLENAYLPRIWQLAFRLGF
jgi:hypothetical protein